MTLRELIEELQSRPSQLLDLPVFVWHDRGGSEPVRAVSVQGTTQAPVSEHFGPFTLVDTPGFGEVAGGDRSKIAQTEISQEQLALLLLDAGAGVRQADFNLYNEIRALDVLCKLIIFIEV